MRCREIGGSSGKVVLLLSAIGLIAFFVYSNPAAQNYIRSNASSDSALSAIESALHPERSPGGSSSQSPPKQSTNDKPHTPFQPGLTLTDLWARQGYEHHGKWDPTARATVKLEGYITDQNVTRVQLFRNDEYLRDLPIAKNSNETGQWIFRTKFTKGLRRSLYTFRASDRWNRMFEKTYNFYPRITQFRWNGKTDGTFSIPFAKYDPRMDSYFLVRTRGFGTKVTTRSRSNSQASFERW